VYTAGDNVRLVGILSNNLLNGAIGTVVRDTDSESRGRYGVQLRSPDAAIHAHPSAIGLKPSNLIRLSTCALSECNEISTKACSACSKEAYCCSECQKLDWKKDKVICPILQKI
jgi:hypothetical protein